MRSKRNKKKIIIATVFAVLATSVLFNSINAQKALIAELDRKIQQQQKAAQTGNASQQEVVPEGPEKEKFKAVVAADDINVGDIFTLHKLKIEEFFEDELPSNYFKTPALVVGKKASKNIIPGAFITPAEVQVTDMNTIDIPKDVRAVTIPAENFEGLASHIIVGSRVDILKKGKPPEFIAQNVSIVAFEEPTNINNPQPKTKKSEAESANLTAKKAGAITFLIPVDIVSDLVFAMSNNKLQLIARNSGDDKIIMPESDLPPPPSFDQVTSMPDVPKEVDLPPPKMPKPEPRKVEIIKANTVSSIEFDSVDFQASEAGNDESLSNKKLQDLLDMLN